MPSINSKPQNDAEKKKLNAKKLQQIYNHIALNTTALIAPFTQRADIMMLFKAYNGDISQVSAAMAQLASISAIFEFMVNSPLTKLSDQFGRKAFLMLGPAVNIVLKTLVFLYPTYFFVALDRIVSNSFSTISGTTVAIASMSDLFSDTPMDFAKALSGLSNYYGVGLLFGPILGLQAQRWGGHPRYAFLVSAFFAALQLVNASGILETLSLKDRKPFKMSDINPFSFLKIFKEERKLFTASIVGGALQQICEGKNLADVHQSFSRRDVGMNESERSTFVAFIGIILFVNPQKYFLRWFGGPKYTTLAIFANHIGGLLMYSTLPLVIRQAWTMMFTCAVSSIGWGASDYPRAIATKLAIQAGWGRGEYSGALAQLRAAVAVVTPYVLGNIYAWSTSNGRSYPGLAYQFVSVTGILTYFYWRTITDEDIEEINSKSKKKIDSKYKVGDKIKAKAIGWQSFYGGKVTKVSKNKNGMVVYEVKFEDGEVQKHLKEKQIQLL